MEYTWATVSAGICRSVFKAHCTASVEARWRFRNETRPIDATMTAPEIKAATPAPRQADADRKGEEKLI